MAELNPNQEPEKLDLSSLDVAEQKRRELYELFPEVRTEGGKIDFDRLKAALGEAVDASRERYGMNWPGKAECMRTIQAPSMGTLLPMREESVDWDTTGHVIIEGDNLEVLKLLQKSYLGKVKMIFIDPPYNTGNDFIYPDNFSESLQTYLEYTGQVDSEGRRFGTNTDSDGRFHSRWMNMMFPRLYLARNLLSEEGVIFITIDDNEVSNLRKICDDVFGEENFIATVAWKHTQQSKNDEKYFSRHYNCVVIYRRSDKAPRFLFGRSDEDNKAYSNPDNDPKGPWRSGDVRSPNLRQTLRYPIEAPNGKVIQPPEDGWRWKKEEVLKKIESGEIVFSTDQTRIIRKIYLSDQDGRTPENVWMGDFAGTSRGANAELKQLFSDLDEVPFDTPKPTLLVKRMLELAAKSDNDVVLDFFAGSGTTAHAVMEQSATDKIRRRFLLIQIPEPVESKQFESIADVCKERVRRAGQSIASKDAELFDGDSARDLGFRCYRLSTSNFIPWDGTASNDADQLAKQLQLGIEHTRDDRTPEDLLWEILLKSWGEPALSLKVDEEAIEGVRVFSIADGAFLICLEEAVTLEFMRALAARKPDRVVMRESAFVGNDQLKVNAVQTFKTAGVTSFKVV